ncbi:MAG: response regulator [Candidatus Binatia bacterium]
MKKRPQKKKRILIVEDNPDLIILLQKLVKLLGYDSIVAMNGKQAVDMAIGQMPDLILMDIILPEMDGLEATRLIRKNPKTHSIPIIAVTGRISRKDREKYLQSGCDDYIVKPFARNQLASCIKKLLN